MAARKKAPAPIKLGDIVKDQISGLQGTAYAFMTSLSGTTAVSIHPQIGKGKGVSDNGIVADLSQVTFIKEGPLKAVEPDDVPIELGSKVQDRLTGFIGFCLHKLVFITGCTSFSLLPVMKPDDTKIGEDVSIDWKRLVVLDPPPTLAVSAKADEGKPLTGGPIVMSGRCA